jgi:long-subunit fatty acid transport protein
MNTSRPKPPVLLLCLLILTALLPPRSLAAQDLACHEPSARAAGLGGAFTARGDDTAALFYNPAGLAFLDGLRLKTNISLGSRTTDSAWPDGSAPYRSDPYEILGAHAVSWQPFRRVTLATGLFPTSRFDHLWNASWSGRLVSTLSKFVVHSFRTAVAVEVVKDFAVSAGVDVVEASLAWRYRIDFDIPNYPLPQPYPVEGREELGDSGVGFVAGVMWKVFPAVQIGASYRSAVGFDLAGLNVFAFSSMYTRTVPAPDGEQIPVYDLMRRFYQNQPVTGGLTQPREIACGIALTPFAKLSLYADVVWTEGSAFGQWTFRSTNPDDGLTPYWPPEYEDFYGMAPDYGTQSVAFALQDARRIKAGLEYRLPGHMALRAGYARYESSVGAADRTPVFPDLERSIYSLGFGYEGPVFSIWRNDRRIADLSFDVFARYAAGGPEGSTFPGYELTYTSKRFSWGVGVGFGI